MFIARWQLSTRFGKTAEALDILRKWEIDVGQRIGWRPGSIRIASGVVGAAQTDIEFQKPASTPSPTSRAPGATWSASSPTPST